jgi:hypothetical protein
MLQSPHMTLRCCRVTNANVLSQLQSSASRSFSTSSLPSVVIAKPVRQAWRCTNGQPRRLPMARSSCRAFSSTSQARQGTTSSTGISSPSTISSRTTTTGDATALTWNRFLGLRKVRRRISLASSVIGSVVVIGTGLTFITSSDFDSVAAQTLGLDPIAVLGLSAAALGATGWLLGPAFGNTLFAIFWRGSRRGFEAVRDHNTTTDTYFLSLVQE